VICLDLGAMATLERLVVDGPPHDPRPGVTFVGSPVLDGPDANLGDGSTAHVCGYSLGTCSRKHGQRDSDQGKLAQPLAVS